MPDPRRSRSSLLARGFTPGRFVLADTDGRGARDPIGLTSQVKFMREGLETSLNAPVGLVLVVVQESERKAAVARILEALEGTGNGP